MQLAKIPKMRKLSIQSGPQCQPLTPAPRIPSSQRANKPIQICPRLYISDLSVAESSSALSALGVTHIVSAMRGNVVVPSDLDICHRQWQLDDSPFAELAEHLPATTDFIHEALSQPSGVVLVHCIQGISRSTSVVAAYLVASQGCSPTEAIDFIKSKHPIAEPNFGFVKQLGEYASQLMTRRGTR